MIERNQKKSVYDNELELDEVSLKTEITSEGIFQQFYSSELDLIRLREFQNPKYLQEISLDGTKFKYLNEQFDYAFPLRSQILHYQPEIKEIFDIEYFDQTKQNPICVASTKLKIAIAYSETLQIWNQKRQKEFLIMESDICCLDFCQDSVTLVCGQNKNILIVDSNKGLVVQKFLDFHQQRMIVLRCIYYKDESFVTTSIDVSGQSLISVFSKGIFSFTKNEKEMLDIMQFPTGAMKSIQLKDQSILLVVNSIQFLWILSIKFNNNKEVSTQLVLEVKNPRKIRDSQIFKTCCSIGRGLVRRQGKLERKYIVIYVWDNKLYHIIIENSENITQESNEFTQTKQINLACQIYECSFVKDSLYMLYTSKGMIIMNTLNIDANKPNIELSQIKHWIFQQFSTKPGGQQLRKCKYLMKKVTQQYVRMKLYNDPIISYNQQFSNQVALINGKCINGILVGQNQIIRSLIEKEEWLYCMNFLLSLYLGYNEYFSEYLELNSDERQSLIKHNVEELSLKYSKFCLNLIKNNNSLIQQASKYMAQELKNTNYTLLSILIEFLLKCNSYELLFVRIMNDVNFQLKDNHQFFLYCLQPFYSLRLVRQVPTGILGQIVQIYTEQNRLDLLQMLIQSIDHKNMTSDQLIKLCLKYGLMKSLAVICSQGDQESYLTPIFKIWSVILIMIEKQDFEISQYYASRALALMKMVFEGYDVLGDKISERKAIDIQRQLSNWILNEENLERLTTLQTISTFEILLKQLEFQKIHDDNSFSKTLLMVSKVISLIQAGNNEFQKAYQAFNKIENYLEELKGYYNFFQIRCFLLFGGHKQRIIQHLNYMLKNIHQFSCIYFTELIDSIKDNEYLKIKVTQWQYKKDIIDFLKQQYFLKILQKLENNADESDMQDILGLSYEADFTTFSMINVHFAEKKNEYARAFDFYLSSHNRFIKSLVFEWVTGTMNQLKDNDQQNFNSMKAALILKISDLIQIDWNKTRIIFSNYNSESESEVIDKLQQFPELQLQYIENVIRRERELGHKINDELLKLNISLLAQINPDKILEEVQNYDYPLDDILKTCQESNILSAQAYILERMGRISESVTIYCKKLKIIIQKHKSELDSNYKLAMSLGGGQDEGGNKMPNLKALFPLGKKKQGTEGQLNVMKPFEDAKIVATQEIVEEIQKIIKVCKNDNKLDTSEEKWYTFLDQLIDIRDNLVFNSPSQSFMKDSIFTAQICHIFATIAEISDLDTLIYQLQNRYNKLDLGQLKKAFQEIIQNYLFTQNSQSNVQFLLMKDIYEKLKTQIIKYSQGLFSKRICYKNRIDESLDNDCKVTNDDFIVFQCKHSYHKKCVMMQQGLAFCNICFKTDQHYSYKIYSINSKIELNGEEGEDQTSKDNEILKQEIENVQQFNNKSGSMNSDDIYFIPKVSEDTLEKRKKRVNKLYYWDRKRMENFNIMEETNRDIDYCNSQEEMKKKKKELEEKQQILNKKRIK